MLETENILKKLLAECLLEIGGTREVVRKVVTAPARREVVRTMVTRGLSERRALTVVHMSAAAIRMCHGWIPIPAKRDRIVLMLPPRGRHPRI